MADSPKPRIVTLDPEAAKRADEALGQMLEAEVKRRIDQEHQANMDAAQMQAAIVAAEKKAADSTARADAAEAAAKSASARVDSFLAEQKAKADAAQAVADAETLRRATFLAEHKGAKGDALASEAKRLAALGRAAVDELLLSTPAPQADPLMLGIGGPSAPSGPQKVLTSARSTKNGPIVTYTLNDPALTVPSKGVRA